MLMAFACSVCLFGKTAADGRIPAGAASDELRAALVACKDLDVPQLKFAAAAAVLHPSLWSATSGSKALDASPEKRCATQIRENVCTEPFRSTVQQIATSGTNGESLATIGGEHDAAPKPGLRSAGPNAPGILTDLATYMNEAEKQPDMTLEECEVQIGSAIDASLLLVGSIGTPQAQAIHELMDQNLYRSGLDEYRAIRHLKALSVGISKHAPGLHRMLRGE